MALTQDERRWIEGLERCQCRLKVTVKGDEHSSGLQGRVESLETTRLDNERYSEDEKRRSLRIMVAVVSGLAALVLQIIEWLIMS